MQALDNFISPIPSFDGDILIPAVPVLARPPSYESVGASASASKTRGSKQKEPVNLTP
jgi:hypothetical protein